MSAMTRRILLALTACGLATATLALPPQATSPPITAADDLTVSGVPLAASVPGKWSVVSKRAQFGGFSPNGGYNGGTPYLRTGWTSRLWEQIPPGAGVSALRLVYSAYGYGPAWESAGFNPVTCTASIEYSKTNSAVLPSWSSPNGPQVITPPVTLNGATSWIIPVNGTITTDPINVYLAGGASYYVRTYCNDPIGRNLPVRVYAGGNFDGTNIGFLSVTFGTGNGVATSFSYTAPVANQPIVPGSIVFSVPGNANVTDNGSGGCSAGAGVASCTINYATGVVQIVTSAPLANAATMAGWLVGGAANGDQTQATALTNFATGSILYSNPMIGPVAVLGRSMPNSRIKSVAVLGDSINEGIGNTANVNNDTGYMDYAARSLGIGMFKGAASGEQLLNYATITGWFGRYSMVQGVDRISNNTATNDIFHSASVSNIINYFLSADTLMAGLVPHGGKDVWWMTMIPRTDSSNVAYVPAGGPYTAAGAAYGSGAVVSPTPLGGLFASGAIGNGILSCTITGTGSVGPYACAFGRATMIGSLWSDASYSTVIDTGAGGTGATTLTGNLLSTGTHTPSTGAVSLTFLSALANGQTVKLYAFASGPSAKNAWNYFLYNYAIPKGLLGGVIDTASCVETSSASATGAGSGQWISSSYTADWTHPSPTAHQTTMPACVASSPFWAMK